MKKQFYIIIVLALVILGVAFYWYELRPLFIKRECFAEANRKQIDRFVVLELTKETKYNNCLRIKGIKE